MTDIHEISVPALAYLGDCVIELCVRRHLVVDGGLSTSAHLNAAALDFVRAPAQAEAMKRLLPHLTEEETAYFRRGRNMGHSNVPKRATVSEYRAAYPDKAVTYFAQNYPAYGWAILLAGGSCPTLRIADDQLLQAIPQMNRTTSSKQAYTLSGNEGALVYLPTDGSANVTLKSGNYALYKVDMRTGECTTLAKSVKVSSTYKLKQPQGLYWLKRL